MNSRITRTTVWLAAAITLAVATAFAVGAFLYSNQHLDTLLETARRDVLGQGELIREALEHQMLEKDRGLIGRMVRGFGSRPDIESLAVLDHRGRVWYSTDPAQEGQVLSPDEQACRSCHEVPTGERSTSQILLDSERSLVRVVVPIRNDESCQPCHDPAQSVNGLVILGSDLGPTRAVLERDLWWMVVGSAVLAFILVTVVVGLVQFLILRRLRKFETAARSIADGDLEKRVPVEGSDAISWLGREFNTMADSMTGLLREVGHQRERLETVINSIDDGIVVLDPQRRVVAANTSFLERTGCGREAVLGCVCGDVAGGVCNTDDCPTRACLDTGTHQVRLCQRVGPAGEIAWEEVHSSPVRGSDGEILQVVEVWRDISDRRGAEARMAESHRLASLGMLASGFSHEINTPLATVLTCLEGILREIRAQGPSGASVRRIDETASVARDQILRCKGITQHFLRLSRGQSTPGEVVDVEEALKAVFRLVGPTAQARGVRLEVAPMPTGIRVRADDSDLQHALINLLINAVEACSPGGLVRVEVEVRGEVRIRVSDTGPGIPPREMERIFEPFVSFREGGTGLGLFLALNFVRQWGGDIQARSPLGEGATFEMLLPLVNQKLGAEVGT